MKFPITISFLALAAFAQAGEKSLFNGTDLTGWKGQPEFWSVKDGAITGQSTKENPVKENTFLILQDLEAGDFELHFKYKLTDESADGTGYGNSGVQYRSKVVKPEYSVVSGYQADFECGKAYSGILYEEKGRGILAKRGEKVVIQAGADPKKPKIEVTGAVGKPDEIQAAIKHNGWNEFIVIAKGGHLQHFINGKQTVDVTDETEAAAKSGIFALQLHAGKPMTVQFKDIILKTED
ncbi:MAG: DUF1080 domain-containing protein [Akkermansiaceae bacterium]